MSIFKIVHIIANLIGNSLILAKYPRKLYVMIVWVFFFSGEMWYLSAKQRLWRGKAIKDSWKRSLRLTGDS